MRKITGKILLGLSLLLLSGIWEYALPQVPEGVEPIPWNSVEEPDWVSRSRAFRLYGRTETDVHLMYSGVEVANDVIRDRDFKAIASVIVLLGVLFMGLLTLTFKVTVIDLVAYIVSSILVFGLLTSNPSTRVIATSFSPTVNRYLPAQFTSDRFEVSVPFGTAIVIGIPNYIAKKIWDMSNKYLSQFTYVNYGAYPYKLAEGYINILEKFGGLPTVLKPVLEHFVNQCVASPLASQIDMIMKIKNQETIEPWPSIPQSILSKLDLRAVLEKASGSKVMIPAGIIPEGFDLPGVDPDSGGITTCKELYHSIQASLFEKLGSDIVATWNALSSGSYYSAGGPTGNIDQTIKTLGAGVHMSTYSIQTYDGTQPAVTTSTAIANITLSEYLRTNLANLVKAENLEAGSNVEGGLVTSILKPIWRVSKKTAFDLASLLGGIFSEFVETIYPMALGLLYFILYLGLPVIILLSLLPGNSWWMGILDYMRLLLFAHLIPVALMWGDQFSNLLLNTNVIAKVVYSRDSIYSGVFGSLIPQDIIDRLIVNANIARGVGNLLALLSPMILYLVLARGSISGVFSALTTGISSLTAGATIGMAISGTAMGGITGAGAGASLGLAGGVGGSLVGASLGSKIGAMGGGMLGQSTGSGLKGIRF